MAGQASEENHGQISNAVDEAELKPRIAKPSEYIDEDDAEDENDSNSGESDDDNDDDYIASEELEDTSQLKQNTVTASGGVKPKSKSRIKAIGKKMRSALSSMKTKPDPSFEAKLKKLQQKIRELEDEKVVVQSKMEQMKLEKNLETEAVIKERDGLQAEITHLQSRMEDLMTKLDKAECELEEATQRQNIAACIELHQISGMLWKRGISGPTGRMWRRRWFKPSNDGRLWYYRSFRDNAIPRGYIDMKKITEVQDLPVSEENREKSCFNVVTPKRTFEIRAKDEEDKKRWLEALDHLLYWIKHKASFNEGKTIPCTEKH